MPTQTTNLFLLEDIEDAGKTSELAESDLDALHAVADWIKSYVVKPHKELGRAGPVCPFVPGALERRTFWLAPEQIADRDVPAVVELMDGYRRLFLDAQPTDGDDAKYKVIVVVFTDLPADRAPGVFDDVLQHLAVPSYIEDGILYGPFYEGHEGTAIYNSSFRPFRSPVPFLFVRHGVVSDWKFFLDNEDWLTCGSVALENPQSTLLLRNCAACRGAWGATMREWPRFERSYLMPPTAVLRERSPASLVGWGETEPSSTRVMPVAHHPAASTCASKFSRAYSHRTIAGGIGHNLRRNRLSRTPSSKPEVAGRRRGSPPWFRQGDRLAEFVASHSGGAARGGCRVRRAR